MHCKTVLGSSLHIICLSLLLIGCPFLEEEPQSEYTQEDSWQLLAAIKSLDARGELVRDKKDKTLNGKPFSLIGYIYPLGNARKQTHFLLSPYSPSCGFCSTGGVASTVEVFSRKPIEYSYEPVKLTGTLKFAEHAKMGLYFQLLNAELN